MSFLYLAPAEGLLLNRVSYKNYNVRDYIPDKVNAFDENEEAEMLKFKRDEIYQYIINVEEKTQPYIRFHYSSFRFKNWLLKVQTQGAIDQVLYQERVYNREKARLS